MTTVAVTLSDLRARPDFAAPMAQRIWKAWWEDKGGIGRAIVLEAAHRAFALGFETIYLCATPQRRGFYTAMGWEVLEENVDGDGLIVFRMQASG